MAVYYPFYFDWTMLIVLPGLILAMIAQSMVSSAFSKYSQVGARCGMSGAQMARWMLDQAGLQDVPVEQVAGRLSDHYDPSKRVLRLSTDVYNSDSLSALGVAAHEAGHALQHRDGYAPLVLRTAIVPAVNIGSNLSWPIFLVGLIFSWQPLVTLGIVLFSLAVVFSLVTLPVEFNASRRAVATLAGSGMIYSDELPGVQRVLRAAAMTYVASALSAILQLVRLLVISGRTRNRD